MVSSYSGRSSSESEDETYEVEQVVGKRKKLSRWEYLIKWKGYGVEENSWEPEDNLFGCSEAIDKYNGKPRTREPQKKRQSRKMIGMTAPPVNPKTTMQLQEMDVAKYRVIHQISSPPLSPLVKDKRETQFSEYEYEEAKPQHEEKSPKDKMFAEKKGTSALKIIATIILFLLLILALVKPVNFGSSSPPNS